MARRNIAKEIEAGLLAAIDYMDGKGPALVTHVIAVPDVKKIRQRMKLSQGEFSTRFSLNRRTLQEWEQKRREPDQIARVLLQVIDAEPEAVDRAMAGAGHTRKAVFGHAMKAAAEKRKGENKSAAKSTGKPLITRTSRTKAAAHG